MTGTQARATPSRRSRAAVSLPAWVEPQLATLTRERFSDPGWVFERKLDGERCLTFADSAGVRLISRNQRDITSTYPDVAAALAAQITTPGQVLDGEIVAFSGSATSFARLQQRLGLAHPSASLVSEVPVIYYIFDVMYSGGQDVRPLPQLERRRSCGACCRSMTRSGTPSIASATGSGTSSRPAATAGKALSPSAPPRRTRARGRVTG
jgi:ATP-dependent DNA ligase